MIRFGLCIAAAVLPAASAQAGAWTLDEGHGQIFVTSTSGFGDGLFDADGARTLRPAFTKTELLAYAEYGWTPWLTVVAKAGGFAWLEDGADTPTFELSPTGAGARVRLLAGESWSLSAEALAGMLGALEGAPTDPARDGVEGELRLSAGIGGTIWNRAVYADVQTGWRVLFDGGTNEALADVVAGAELWGPLALTLESRNRIRLSADGPDAFREFKASAGLSYQMNARMRLTAGWQQTLGGANALDESGPVAGIHYVW